MEKISINPAVIFSLIEKGNLLFAHRSHDPADRPAPAKLLEEIDRIKSRTAGEASCHGGDQGRGTEFFVPSISL